MASIKQRDSRFVQTGTAPNWQGGVCSLCTCKHEMRTFLDAAGWPGVWVAGFSGLDAGRGRNALVYLMRVRQAFPSHAACWYSSALSDETKQAKAAHLSEVGDLFQPRGTPRNPFEPASYYPPRAGHDHAPDDVWHSDIAYRGRSGRPAALLVGDVMRTFIWDRPALFLPGSIGKGQRKGELGHLLDCLDGESLRPRTWAETS